MLNNEKERKTAEKFIKQYGNQEETKFEKLKKLDGKVKNPARIFAYIFGSIGALVLGIGMCLAMKVIGNLMGLGVAIGLVGIAMVSINYIIYKAIIKARKSKFSQQILSLSNEMLNQN